MQFKIKFRRIVSEFQLDLVAKDSISGKGMVIDSIYQNNVPVDFKHENDKITVYPKHPFLGITYTYSIKYSGEPKDGLIISKNKHGDRTFFSDNWPNRAHHWMPCVDHPSDKATIEYHITAPKHYQVVANGQLEEKTNLTDALDVYHWKTSVPLPTKVMVIGIAHFAIQEVGSVQNIPVSTWVYPQTKEQGFADFAIATDILDFFIEKLGDYPYKKLANVQSKTRFGGMENAGAIFYFENSVTGEKKNDNLIAHEIAHQWFGNSASEIDWPHVWLSEGFATYLANVYAESTKGDEAFKEKMIEERDVVLNFYKNYKRPVVDEGVKDYMQLLNPNSYKKGAWILHMLRKQVGDDTFFKGLRMYYELYQFSNASSQDFENVMEHVSGQELDAFFDQWLYKTGQPIIKINWISHNNKVRIIVDQVQDTLFEFLMDLELIYEDGTSEIKTVDVQYKSSPFVVEASQEVKKINIDPNAWLLHELAE
jgi:aminopeptidase N